MRVKRAMVLDIGLREWVARSWMRESRGILQRAAAAGRERVRAHRAPFAPPFVPYVVGYAPLRFDAFAGFLGQRLGLLHWL